MLPDASGVTELAVPILVWALATIGAAKNTTSDSAEIQCRPSVLVIVVTTFLLK